MDKIADVIVWAHDVIISGRLFSSGEIVDPAKSRNINKYIAEHPDSVCSKQEYKNIK